VDDLNNEIYDIFIHVNAINPEFEYPEVEDILGMQIMKDGMVNMINDQDGLYTLFMNGIKKGEKIFTKHGEELLEIIYTDTNELHDIWEHQFVRVKLLRNLFESFPDRPFKAKEMDTFPLKKGYGEKCYISAKNLVVFGESTSRGELTENCVASFKKWGLEIPTGFAISNKYHLSGQLPYNILGQEVTLPKKLQAKVTELTRWYWRKRVGNV
jgi:hypothetical protein